MELDDLPFFRGEIASLFGGTEETTTGVFRLRSLDQSGALRFPVIAVNEANAKHQFDNRYGSGQSTMDALDARCQAHQPMRIWAVEYAVHF